jgi:hypothetical protein
MSGRGLTGQQGLGTGVGRHHEALVRGQVQATELLQRQQVSDARKSAPPAAVRAEPESSATRDIASSAAL